MSSFERLVNYAFPDNPGVELTFIPQDSILINVSGEILPKTERISTANGVTGIGSVTLPVPDDTGRRVFRWLVMLPDGEQVSFDLGYGPGPAELGLLLAMETMPMVSPSVLASLVARYSVPDFLMQRDTVKAGEAVVIPENHTMLTKPLDIETGGSIKINGRLTILGSAAEASRQEFGHAAARAVYDHNLQRENVHGIADTRLLETQAGAQAKAEAAAAAAQAYAVQRANHTGTQLLATISDAGTMAAQAATNYYTKSEFSSAPGAAEKPLKSDSAGTIYPKMIVSGSYRISNFYALQMPATGRTLVGHTTGSGSNMTCVGYYAGYARSYADSIAIGAYANPTKANQAVIGGDGGYGTSQINALTVVSGTSGGALEGNGKSSTTAAQSMARFEWSWIVNTHATRQAQAKIYARDYAGERLAATFGANGSAATIGLLGASPIPRQSVAADASDLASAIALVNDVKAKLQSFGLFS